MQYPRNRKFTPTSLNWKAYIDLQLGTGDFARQPLLEQHCVIGRSPNLEITLDHDTVSRRHAELFCDPFGRWWIRDLGSTNGTVVNGERVNEKVLQPGDRIGVGDYSLFFNLIAPAENRPRAESDAGENALIDSVDPDSPTFVGSPSWIRSLRDLDPPKIAATHLSTLMDFSRRLMSIEHPDERLTALCQLMIGDEFHASLAMALRLRLNPGSSGRPPTLTGLSSLGIPAVSLTHGSQNIPITPIGIPKPTESSNAASSSIKVLCGPLRPKHQQWNFGDAPYISRRVLQEVQETGQPALASNLPRDAASLELTLSADVAPLSAVACPLRRDDHSLELLYVTLPPQFGSDEWLALIALASEAYQQSESAWAARQHEQAHAAIERELETARQIQQALVPKTLAFPNVDVAIGFDPCKWVGGDYVDTLPMKDGRILMAVADVCGKGLQAALVTFSVHTMIRATADSDRTLAQLIQRLNEHLCGYLPQESFVTMVCVALDTRTGDLECLNAGHMPPLVVGVDGTVRPLQSAQNPVLGVAPLDLITERGRMEPGELLCMYTDGLTELRNPAREMLGEAALSEGVARLQMQPGSEVSKIATGLNQLLQDYSENQVPEDDRAYLLARRRS